MTRPAPLHPWAKRLALTKSDAQRLLLVSREVVAELNRGTGLTDMGRKALHEMLTVARNRAELMRRRLEETT